MSYGVLLSQAFWSFASLEMHVGTAKGVKSSSCSLHLESEFLAPLGSSNPESRIRFAILVVLSIVAKMHSHNHRQTHEICVVPSRIEARVPIGPSALPLTFSLVKQVNIPQ
jgi:hypothetical protein